VTARADNHLILGIAAVGAGVSELSAAFALALEMGARLEDIAGSIHALGWQFCFGKVLVTL
jgi:dihydrolipoamide dehydrogenase